MLKVKRKITIKNSGLTLIEMLVAMSIFAVAITVVMSVFVSKIKSQREVLEINMVQREAGYLMETVSRELRMAKAMDSDQENNSDHSIEFTNYEGELIKYCKSNNGGNCSESGEYFSRDKENINSDNIIIEKLMFYTPDSFIDKQPVITIVMKVKSADGFGTEFVLQNSVSLRLY